MLRIDRDVIPTMAKTPTLGHVGARSPPHHRERRASRTRPARDPPRDRPRRRLGPAGAGLARRALRRLRTAVPTARARLGPGQDPAPDDPGRLPVLQRGARRLRGGNPRRRPRAQPPVPAQHPARHPASWARMQVRGTVAARRFGAEPDIAAWANGCALNPARIPSQRRSPAVKAAATRLAAHRRAVLARMASWRASPCRGVSSWAYRPSANT